MSTTNNKLKPSENGTFPARKLTPMYNYRLGQGQWAIAKKSHKGITTYLDADGSKFTSHDCDPERYPLADTLTGKQLEMFEAIALEAPAEALNLFKALPEHLKPQLRAAMKVWPIAIKKGLKDAAGNAPQSNAEPQEPALPLSASAQLVHPQEKPLNEAASGEVVLQEKAIAQWKPSTSEEELAFHQNWCRQCAVQPDCELLYVAQPKQWVLADGEPKCTALVERTVEAIAPKEAA